MADYKLMKIDEMRGSHGGAFKLARSELGVGAWGMQVLDIPAGFDGYPEHDHSDIGQEEVYIPLSGSAEFELDGERHSLEPGAMLRVGEGVTRTIRPGPDGLRLLALGGTPGSAYSPRPGTEVSELDQAS